MLKHELSMLKSKITSKDDEIKKHKEALEGRTKHARKASVKSYEGKKWIN